MKSPLLRDALAGVLVLAVIALWWLTARDEPGPWLMFAAWHVQTFLINLGVTYVAGWGLRMLLTGNPRRTLFEWILVNISIAFVLLVLELPAYLGFSYARVLGLPEAAALTRLHAWENPNNIGDPDLMYRHKPHSSFQGMVAGDLVPLFGVANQPKHSVAVRYDHNGFRNEQDLQQADVVVIGDLYVEGGLVSAHETLSTQLGKLLGKTVANLGVFGYGPQQERIVLERYALPLKPKLIVWVFFDGNDLKDAARYADYKRAPREFMQNDTRFLDRSLVSNLLRRVASLSDVLRRQDAPSAQRRSCRYTRAKQAGDRTLYFVYDGNESEFYDQLPAAQAEILAAKAAADAAGAGFLLVHATVAFRLAHDLCESAPDSVLREWKALDDLPQRMQQLAAQHNIAWLDLGPAFRAAIEAGRFPFFPDDGHWDAEGHALAAQAIADKLRSDPALLAPR